MIGVSGPETSGRYVVVQMDKDGEDPLNLLEVKDFGRAAAVGN